MFSSPLSTISCLLAASHRSTLLNTWTSCTVTRSLLDNTDIKLSSSKCGQSMLSLTRSKFHFIKFKHSLETSLYPQLVVNWYQETTWFFLPARGTFLDIKSSPTLNRSLTLYLSASWRMGMTFA